MSRRVRVDLAERGYDIHIGRDLSFALGMELRAGTRVLLVTDSNVDPLYGAKCQAALERQGLSVSRTVIPAGEESKNLDQVRRIYDAAVAARMDRGGLMVALGGGMVGDLAGFAAATYLRGVRFAQMPTTLLAMVDSSVGGKTGVNIEQGKNLVGAFHQPVAVLADLATLETLSDREYAAGLAEVVKYGVIWDAMLFRLIEEGAAGILRRDAALMESVVARCCEIKAEVVAVDERESGVRAILNFGHTLGHALENVAGYGRLLHGEAVAIGMAYAAGLSVRLKGFPAQDADRLRGLLRALRLPTGPEGGALPWKTVRAAMDTDKKSQGGLPRFVLVERLGAAVFGCEVPESVLGETYGGLPCQP